MRRFITFLFALLGLVSGAHLHAGTNMLGFAPANEARQRNLEAEFDRHLDPEDQRAWLEQMSSQPNHVGSPHDKANAEFILAKFREWGWQADIETFHVLYPTPEKIGLEMVAPARFKAGLQEPAVEGDRTSGAKGALPPYLAYAADGDVTADLVYVNQGMPDDYKELGRRGISVKGCIVIARYGGGWRGLKPKLAYEHGAVGCLIYSDPKEDGYGAGEVWPQGGWRPAAGVQRGSVQDLPVMPGDPLTPNIGAVKDAKRLSIADAKTVLKIPALPISHSDAQPLLAALGGPVAPASWRGGLPITYHFGPGPAKVHLTLKSDWSLKPIYNVIAKMQGSEFPDEWIIRGNHHDGWVFGAWDPLSANVALLAEAKAIGLLNKAGSKPRRTIVYASWDGEEPGLLGSSEWAETHAEELRRKAVLYVNSDTNGRGFLRAGGSHSWQNLVNQVTADVRDPQTGATVQQRLRARLLVEGAGGDSEDRQLARRLATGAPPPLYALGSGSDYSPFLQHLGIASLDIRYGGEDKDRGVYHSVYDSYDHYVRFGDPDFAYGVAMAQTIGRVIMRSANADLLPMRATDFADAVSQYADELHKLVDGMRERTENEHRLLDEGLHKLAADPTETYMAPQREGAVPFLNFAPLDNCLSRLKRSAKAYDAAFAAATSADAKVPLIQRARLNRLLQGAEQALIYPAGLPGRDWFRHMIYAPGLRTGYDVKTLPGMREAIEQRQWSEADQYSGIIAAALSSYCEKLDEAASHLVAKPDVTASAK